ARYGAKYFAARSELDAHELLRRPVPGQFVVDRGRVVHPIDDGDILVVVEMFAKLLEAAVQVSDVRRGADDSFAIQLKHQSKGGMRGGMLRTEVQGPAVSRFTVLCFGKQIRRGLGKRVRHGAGL